MDGRISGDVLRVLLLTAGRACSKLFAANYLTAKFFVVLNQKQFLLNLKEQSNELNAARLTSILICLLEMSMNFSLCKPNYVAT
ncbi:uncharacterized protein RCO7_08988 [Rhynchosporium graminicola]|uniref:Uncharacterized protein n=1 Tax=Rhynchosporium graminicola TaxID=2792576 RepID=A0A1E1JUP5_9HELO|nr:uncharacterized protein RCO7_08988 [Rhynchosporium commune]